MVIKKYPKTGRVIQSRRKLKAEVCYRKAVKINTVRKEAENNAFVNLNREN